MHRNGKKTIYRIEKMCIRDSPGGDDCLRRVATLIKGSLEGMNSYVVRYGGEEFVAAVFQVDRQAAGALGEQIRRLVEKAAIPDGRGGTVTISVGVYHVSSTLDVSLFDCIQGADKALYQAKNCLLYTSRCV